MRTGLPLWIVLALAAAVRAEPPGGAPERTAYTLPSWEVAVEASDVEKCATREEYETAAKDERYVVEKLRYRSDGLAVIAYLYRPRNSEAAKRPVIVFNRGSYIRKDIVPELLCMFHRLADAGFTIVAPMYRGSDGGEGRDEMGGADLDDLMNIAPLLGQLEAVDTRNVFLYGESRGGMMVFQAVRDGFPGRAAATFGAFTDLGALTSTPEGAGIAKAIWPDFDQRQDEIIARRSAIQWPQQLNLPLLLMHGSADGDVSPTQTLLLATELAKAGKEFAVIVFPGDKHTLFANRTERDCQAVEFFRRHLVN